MFNSKKIKKLENEIQGLNLLVKDMQDDISRLSMKETTYLDNDIESRIKLFLDIQTGNNGMPQGGMC